jgi:predicted small metal-binding protein
MHQTPDLPGTKPVTDNPNPDNTQGAIPTEPGTGPSTGPGITTRSGVNPFGGAPTGGSGNVDPSAPTGGTEGPGETSRSFRCADVGNADCRWEVKGRTEDELMGHIERHGREAHGESWFQTIRSKILDVLRERRAA